MAAKKIYQINDMKKEDQEMYERILRSIINIKEFTHCKISIREVDGEVYALLSFDRNWYEVEDAQIWMDTYLENQDIYSYYVEYDEQEFVEDDILEGIIVLDSNDDEE